MERSLLAAARDIPAARELEIFERTSDLRLIDLSHTYALLTPMMGSSTESATELALAGLSTPAEVFKTLGHRLEEPEAQARALARLHNSERLDLIHVFDSLKAEGVEFFLLRRLFDLALPLIDAPVGKVAHLVNKLVRAAGEDLSANSSHRQFGLFLSHDDGRFREATAEIVSHPELCDLIPTLLHQASLADPAKAVTIANQLARESPPLSQRAIVGSLPDLSWPKTSRQQQRLLSIVTRLLRDDKSPDTLLVCTRSLLTLSKKRRVRRSSATALIDKILLSSDSSAIHSAALLLAYHLPEIPSTQVARASDLLHQVDTANQGTVRVIDAALYNLLKSQYAQVGLDTLASLILSHSDDLPMDLLDRTMHHVASDSNISSLALTQWLLRGATPLCKAISEAFKQHQNTAQSPAFNRSVVGKIQPLQIVFLARKAIGYFFNKPEWATSLLLSLLGPVKTKKSKQSICALLRNPLLLNYQATIEETLEHQLPSLSKPNQDLVRSAIASNRQLWESANNQRRIPALEPSTQQRTRFNELHGRMIHDVFKRAHAKSFVAQICTNLEILYGDTVVHKQRMPDGSNVDTQTQMQSHTVTHPIPAMEILDYVGLDHMLRQFRIERIKTCD